MKTSWGILILLVVVLGLGRIEAAMAIEEPKYEVTTRASGYEIRTYGLTLVAETEVKAGFEDSGNQAFRILADYIFGNNRKKVKIAMTAPVTQSSHSESVSEKIAMTAPVNQRKVENGFLVQFTMPGNYTRETLPSPVDPRVKIREIPPRKIAVLSYSGSWSESRYQEKLTQFREFLKRDQIRVIGEPVFARFNSPFTLWFLRRNEIWIEVDPG